MIKKLVLAAVFAVTPMVLAEESSADHCYSSYRSYRSPAPVISYRSYSPYRHHVYSTPFPSYGRTHSHIHHYHRYPSSLYRSYRGGYGYGYGGYRNSIGVNRGGVSLYFGF